MNHWFGPKSLRPLKGRIPQAGDVVEFDGGQFKPGKGPQCAHVWAILDDMPEQRSGIFVGASLKSIENEDNPERITP